MTDTEGSSLLALSDLDFQKKSFLPLPSEREVIQLAEEIVKTAPRELDDLWDIIPIKRGEEIYSAGTPNNDFYILLKGRARVIKTTDKKGTVWLPKPGVAIDSDFFSTEKKHTRDAVAIEDSEVMIISRELIDQLKDSETKEPTQAFCHLIVQATGNALNQVREAVENAAFMTLRQRLAQHLLELSHAFESEEESQPITATHQWLANNLTVWRESVTEILHILMEKGLVSEAGGEKIKIVNPRGLFMEMLTPAQYTKS